MAAHRRLAKVRADRCGRGPSGITATRRAQARDRGGQSMNWKKEREKALELIRKNIDRHGYHLYVVGGSSVPRWCYTIGFKDALGGELVLAERNRLPRR